MARLPVELYENVFMFCSRLDLVTLAQVSPSMQPEAERVLYRDIRIDLWARGSYKSNIFFCQRICQSSQRAAYVTQLHLNLSFGFDHNFVPALRRLFSLALKCMSQLRTLQFYGTTSIGFNILDRSQFKLHTFESDSEDREAVFRFLYTQDELIDLTLWLPEAPQSNLSPRFLPDLTALGAGAHDISRIIPGRPISHLSVWEDPIPCLSSLKYSARPIKVLQLWNISTADMELIALELPCLEVLWAGYQVCDSNEMDVFILALSRLHVLRTSELYSRPGTYRNHPPNVSSTNYQAVPLASHTDLYHLGSRW